jgi:hypothetical protein
VNLDCGAESHSGEERAQQRGSLRFAQLELLRDEQLEWG